MIEKFEIENADSFNYLKNIPTASIDFILTDPPYNLIQYSTGNMKFD